MAIFRVRDENGNTHDIPAIKGEPGYTPIKGVDYLTDEELAEVEERFCNSVADKITAEQVGARPDTWTPTAEEVGARSDTWTPTAEEVGARPNTWTPTAEEVGARPNDWMPTAEEVGAVSKSGDTLTGSLTVEAQPSGGQGYNIKKTVNSVLEELKLYINAAGLPSVGFHEGGTEVNRMVMNRNSTMFIKPVDISSGGTGATTAAAALANLGAAPAGYGYGGQAVEIGAGLINDENALSSALEAVYSEMKSKETKLIRFSGYPSSSNYNWFGFLFKSSENNGSMVVHSAYTQGTLLTKTKVGGTWQPLEYLNPPMAAGVEYRTTERWGGTPVYTKLLVCTTASDVVGNTTIDFPHGVNNIDVASARIDITTFYNKYDTSNGVSSAWVFPYYSLIYNSQSWYIEKITDTQIKMRSEGGSSSWDAGRTINFLMKYTKKS